MKKEISIEERKAELLGRLAEIKNLNGAAAVLIWDQATYMPSGGNAARGRQLATLRRLAHEQFTAPEIGNLLDDLQPYVESLPHDSDDAAIWRVTRRDYDLATKVPATYAAEIAEHTTTSYAAWADARPANDFATMQPILEKTLAYSRQYGDFFPGYEHIADPLIDQADYGMKVSTVRPLFNELRKRLTPMVKTIQGQPTIDDSCLHQHFPEQEQWDFGVDVIKKFGYDFERGRQDKTHHPFMIQFSLGDVRITTRVNENRLDEYLFSTLHECGHGVYEQGISMEYEGTPLAGGTSAGVHESQSRLWENLVGRSRGFWEGHYEKLQTVFPEQLNNVDLETFYRAINKVEPSLIRTDADEVTYNLHVIIRFELELELLEGTLAIADLPEAWRARYTEQLGVTPPDDVDGVLQDVHWYAGLIGGSFQGYTLGNIMTAQFYNQAVAAHPEIPSQIIAGEFGTLHSWLHEKIYRPGSKFTTAELLENVTGQPLTLEPYMGYLQEKYGGIYSL